MQSPTPLRIVLLDDDPTDALLIQRTLAQQLPGAAVDHVQSKDQYLDRLAAGGIDAIVADSSVVDCEGLRSFHLARQQHAGLPFVILSGRPDAGMDRRGLAALGVFDCLAKSEMERIGPTVERAVSTAREKQASKSGTLVAYEHLVEVVKELSLTRDLPAVMAIVRRAARALTGADGATFVLREGDRCYYADEDAIGPLWKGQRFPVERCLSGWAMTRGQPAIVENIHTDPRIPLSAYEPTFVRSVVMVPIRALDPIGAIGTYWRMPRTPDDDETRLLQALADTTAVAMENVRVYGELEARVAERTVELEAFNFAVSHDLQAPIRHVGAFASILRDDHGDELGDEGRRILERIVTASERMAQMVRGLLELSRTTRADVHRAPCDLAALARGIVQELALATGRAVEFHSPEEVPADADPTLIRTVLQNLLGNAWKFTGQSETPRIELGVDPGRGGPPVYFVRDNGVGFGATGAERLFGLFRRLHSETDFPGTGVGLASARRIVEKHGGKIWARSEPGHGATFFFTLAPGTP